MIRDRIDIKQIDKKVGSMYYCLSYPTNKISKNICNSNSIHKVSKIIKMKVILCF